MLSLIYCIDLECIAYIDPTPNVSWPPFLSVLGSVMTDQTRGLGLEGALGLVSASPESDLGQVWRGLIVISCGLQTVVPAFALQQLRCFLKVESISLGKVGESGNLVKGYGQR